MAELVYSARGKIILLGEHAVVYGHPALAASISEAARVTIDRSSRGSGRLLVPAWRLEIDPRSDESVSAGGSAARAYRALRAELGLAHESPFDLTLSFSVPTASGLGSSAAMAVAIARALAGMHELPLSSEGLFRVAMVAEQQVHGRPSGLDHTIAALTEPRIGRFDRETGFSALNAKFRWPIVVGHTGQLRDTQQAVQRVANLRASRPTETDETLAEIGRLAGWGARAVVDRDPIMLGELMDDNQRRLERLGLSTLAIDVLCDLARRAGALGAKLTGAGCGGVVIALAPGCEEAVYDAWRRAGYSSFLTSIGEMAP